jgi:ribosomal protein L23
MRRGGRTVGRSRDWKKAVVTLQAGETIANLFEGV